MKKFYVLLLVILITPILHAQRDTLVICLQAGLTMQQGQSQACNLEGSDSAYLFCAGSTILGLYATKYPVGPHADTIGYTGAEGFPGYMNRIGVDHWDIEIEPYSYFGIDRSAGDTLYAMRIDQFYSDPYIDGSGQRQVAEFHKDKDCSFIYITNIESDTPSVLNSNFNKGVAGVCVHWKAYTGVQEVSQLDKITAFPNPSAGQTTIQFVTNKNVEDLKLTIYNAVGQQVDELWNGYTATGSHEVVFDGTRMEPGIYFYRLETSKGSITQKMMIHH